MGNFKALLFSSIILAMFVIGCQSDATDTTAPGNALTDNSRPGTPPNTGIEYLKMPRPLIRGNRSVIVQKLVSPGIATNFQGAVEYTSLSGNPVILSVAYKIPAGAVSDTVTVTMEIDTVLVGVKFKPEDLQFSVPTTMDVTVQGLDPFMIGGVTCVYVKEDGTFEPIQFGSLKVTGNLGRILMQKGLLNHFSQYAFGRLTAEENGK